MRVLILSWCLTVSAYAADDVRHLGPVTGIAVTQNAVYSCSQAGVLRNDGDSTTFAQVVRPEFRVIDVVVLSDKQLAICGGRPGASGIVGIVDRESGELNTLTLSKDLVYAAAISPSKGFLAAACADGQLMLLGLPLDPSKAPVLVHKHTAAARAVAFSPDGGFLISGGLDGVLLTTPLDESGTISGETRVLQEHTAGIECLAFSPDGKQIASGARDSKVRLHSTNGRLIRTYVGIGMENELAAERVATRIWALAWNDRKLVAGTSKGQLYHLSHEDDTWTLLDDLERSIFDLAFDANGLLWRGCDAVLTLK